MIICPVCKSELNRDGKSYKCKNNHSFDMAKQGYVNLLLSNQKNSKTPGDDKNMILSRKHFLEKGYYKSISEAVNNLIKKYNISNEIEILDIGCGEGYYTNRVKQSLDENKINSRIYGVDISKEGIIAAGKQYKDGIDWIVASAMNIPLSDSSIDYIICMFAKIVPEEKMRVLKDGGKLIVVSTGKNHLIELKEVVYENVRTEFYSPIEDLKIFKHIERVNCIDKVLVNENESIKNLFDMTPYRWRSPKEGIERLFGLDKLEITIDVNIDIFEK